MTDLEKLFGLDTLYVFEPVVLETPPDYFIFDSWAHSNMIVFARLRRASGQSVVYLRPIDRAAWIASDECLEQQLRTIQSKS